MKFLRLALLSILCPILLSCSKDMTLPTQIANKGILDLRSWNFAKDGIVDLDGEWEFHWNVLARSDSELSSLALESSQEFIQVPSLWNGKISRGKKLKGKGFATHRLKVKLPSERKNLSLSIHAPGSSYELYINGKLVSQGGIVAEVATKSKPYIRWTQIPLEVDSAELDIFYLITNFYDDKGGPWDHLKLGKAEQIQNYYKDHALLKGFNNGSLLILGFYHIILFIFRRKDKSPVYFGFFCLFLLVWSLSVDDRKLLDIFSFVVVHKIEFFTFFTAPLLFVLFFHSLFPDEFPLLVRNIFVLVFGVFGFLVLIFPIQIYTALATLVQISILIFLLFSLGLIFFLNRQKRQGSLWFFIGLLPFALSVFHDILVGERIINGTFLANYGFMVFIFVQSILLSNRFSRALTRSENQSLKLEKSNREILELQESLEAKVEKRTRELIETKQEIEHLNEFTRLINIIPRLEDIFTEISKYVYQKFSIEMCWLSLPTEDGKFFHSFKIYSYHRLSEENYHKVMNLKIPIKQEGGIAFKVFRYKKTIYSPTILKLKWEVDKQIIELTSIKSFLLVPLIVQDECIGIMFFSNISRPFQLSDSDIENINFFCEQIAGVVHNSRLLKQTQEARKIAEREKNIAEESKKEISKLNDLFIRVNAKKDFNGVIQELENFLSQNYSLRYFFVYIKNAKENCLELRKAIHPEKLSEADARKLSSNRIPLDSDICIHAIACKKKRYFYVKNIRKYPPAEPAEAINQNILNMKSILVVPLIAQDEVIGTISFSNFSEDSLDVTKDEIIKISTFCQNIATVMQTFTLVEAVQKEKEKSERLLLNILPRNIANELKETNQVKPVYFHSVSVLFTDFKGFTKIAENMSPEDLIKELDACFSQFDHISERYNLEKLKTIGDSYMCVGGLPIPNATHPIDTCLAALEILDFMNQMKSLRETLGMPYWELRLGIHSGPVMAGIVGEKKFQYDIWSDTVNTASRMESSSEPGRVNISEVTYELVKDFFDCEYRGKIKVKNKGELDMYFLHGLKSEFTNEKNPRVPNGKFFEKYINLPPNKISY